MRSSGQMMTGIGSAIGASLFFTVNDTVIKFLSGGYALHQLVLIRAAVALVFLLVVLAPLTGGLAQLRTARPGAHILRGLFVVGANLAFFLGLSVMPIAEATAVFFVAPLMIAAASVVFLGERVGPHRWGAIGVGLLGTLFIVRPGTESFQLAALLPMTAAACYAGLHMFTRKLGGTESAAALALYVQLTFVATSLAFGAVLGTGHFATEGEGPLTFLTRAWGPLAAQDLPLLALIGLASSMGGFLISQAYRLCEAGLAAPFEYVALPMSVAWGWLVFGEWPSRPGWIGIALILGAGLYLAARELRLAHRARALPA